MIDLKERSLDEILGEEGVPIEVDWNGEPTATNLRFLLGITSTSLIFGLRMNSKLNGLGRDGEFKYGLWEGDVVELFAHEADSSRYFEFNLSPTGAWWAKQFDSYRGNGVELKASNSNVVRGASNEILLCIPLNDFAEGQLLLTETAIINDPKSQYFVRGFSRRENTSVISSLGRTPDFHLRELALATVTIDRH